MPTVVVTGGAGFIGSNIAHELVVRKHRVRIIDNLSTGRRKNIKHILNDAQFIRGDIRNLKTLKRLFRGADYVLHQAALPSVPRSIDNPAASHQANVNGTFNVLLAARYAKVKKVVLASSSSIYGNRKEYGAHILKYQKEVMKPQPLSPYAVNKLIGEEYAKVFAHIFKVPTICLRYFNVFGPRQDPKSEYAAVVPRFISAISRNQRPTIYGDGYQSRDFTFVDNVVHANLLAMTSRVKFGETINIACGDSISLLQLVTVINRILRKHIRPKFEPARPGDVRKSMAGIEKAKRLIGYEPLITFEDGLRKTIAWYQQTKQ